MGWNPDLQQLVFNHRVDAEEALSGLKRVIEQYGCGTVADLKDLVCIPTTYVDTRWGWKSTDGFKIVETGQDVILGFQKPSKLELLEADAEANGELKPFFASVAGRMSADQVSNTKIAHYLGIYESTVRELLHPQQTDTQKE